MAAVILEHELWRYVARTSDWGYQGRGELLPSLNVTETLHQACCGLRWRTLWIKDGQGRLVDLGQRRREIDIFQPPDCCGVQSDTQVGHSTLGEWRHCPLEPQRAEPGSS